MRKVVAQNVVDTIKNFDKKAGIVGYYESNTFSNYIKPKTGESQDANKIREAAIDNEFGFVSDGVPTKPTFFFSIGILESKENAKDAIAKAANEIIKSNGNPADIFNNAIEIGKQSVLQSIEKST